MSRLVNRPIKLPASIQLEVEGLLVKIKGAKGTLTKTFSNDVHVFVKDNHVYVSQKDSLIKARGKIKKYRASILGTVVSILRNMIKGVSDGFEKKLLLVGVGYRAQVSDNSLNLTLGYSHPVDFNIPDGIQISCLSQTEILVFGIDKEIVGQVASKIRAFRPPEPYQGKGIRYSDEILILKEAKKK